MHSCSYRDGHPRCSNNGWPAGVRVKSGFAEAYLFAFAFS